MGLEGKAALVTGGSRGIGAAAARRLAAEGARVTIGWRADEAAARAVVEAIRGAGGEAEAVRGDVGVKAEVEASVERAAERWGRLDVLVNAAGVALPEPLGDVTDESFDRQFGVNVRGTLMATRTAVRRFPEGGGSVVNVSSVNGRRPVPGGSVYSATKAAVDALTVALALELGPRGVRVNAVAPGATDTDMLRGVMPEGAEAMIAGRTALGRLGRPDDMAAAIAWLASDEAGWVTGEIVAADGGLRP